MKQHSFIWDLDGTLLDSYTVIVDSLMEVISSLGLTMSREDVHKFSIASSVDDLIEQLSQATGRTHQHIRDMYTEISHAKKDEIGLMPQAAETLRSLCVLGASNYVYTHRGISTSSVLKKNGLNEFFTDIVTSQDGFARKPAPDALTYLISKHGMNPSTTYYVGDRRIDMECAHNAKVKGILYLPNESLAEPTGYESHVVSSLIDIVSLLK